MESGTVRDKHTHKFYFDILFGETFNYDDGAKFLEYIGTNVEPICV
jgi:hypothetical protein